MPGPASISGPAALSEGLILLARPKRFRTPDPQIRRLRPGDEESGGFCKPGAFSSLKGQRVSPRLQTLGAPHDLRLRDLWRIVRAPSPLEPVLLIYLPGCRAPRPCSAASGERPAALPIWAR